MDKTTEMLAGWLFQTGALRVSPYDMPFWYTSGTLGPYYINTHFLYGSEAEANDILGFIDREKDDWFGFPGKLEGMLISQYECNRIFRGVVDYIVEKIRANIDAKKIAYISGGERRDWFFAPIAAVLLKKPYILIYKDKQMTLFEKGRAIKIMPPFLSESNVMHIADLITEASSFERQWIPAIRRCSGNMRWSCVVVDRMQGGRELLTSKGVDLYSLVSVNTSLFDTALSMGLIDREQHSFVIRYISDPKQCMKEFISLHPGFIANELQSVNAKNRERAMICIEKRIYA